MAGIPISNAIDLLAMTLGVPNVTPPSKELLKAIVLAAISFQAAYASPFGPTNGWAAMDLPGPFGLSMRVMEKLAPLSVDRAKRMPALVDPPLAASHVR